MALRSDRRHTRLADHAPRRPGGCFDGSKVDPSRTAPASSYPSLALIYDLATARLEAQLRRIEALDSKIAAVVGFVGVLLVLTLGSRSLLERGSELSAVGAGLLLAAVLVLLLALRVQTYRLDPDLPTLRTEYPARTPADTQFAIVDNIVLALEANEGRLRWKGRFLNVGGALTFVALACLTGGAIYSLGDGV